MSIKRLTHVTGTFLIQADAAFLNGAGLGEGEDRNVSVPKTFSDGRNKVPYVSSQAWKRWLRNTLVEETGWNLSEIKAIGWNPKGNVKKIAAELNPVKFVEDDIFGYMRAEAGQGRSSSEESEEPEEEETVKGRTKSVIRASPFIASILYSLRSTGWRGDDQGFVHLTKYDPHKLGEAEIERYIEAIGKKTRDKKSVWDKLKNIDASLFDEAKTLVNNGDLDGLRRLLSKKAGEKVIDFIENPCSPLPYATRFYHTHLQGIFCLNYSRLGLYWNLGDRIELEETKAKELLGEGLIKDVSQEEPYHILSENGKIGRVFRITDKVKPSSKERAIALFKSLAVLRGGAKQAQFGTDVSPKALIIAGMTCGNPIFNNLFSDDQDSLNLKIETFKEIIRDYAGRIVTPIFVGIRSGYLKNEDQIRDLSGNYIVHNEKGLLTMTKDRESNGPNDLKISVEVLTPVEVAQRIGEYLS